MLDIRDLRLRFAGMLVIKGVSLAVRPGQFVAILGPSGCGKTTLLRVTAGALRPSAGIVTNSFQRTAMVFQDARLAPWMTALQNAAFGLKAYGIARQEREREARLILLRVGLEKADLAKRPHFLSGGMRQRVGIARALLVRPDLLLLDEPFSSLEIGLRRDMQRLVRTEVDLAGIAAILVTHDIAEAVRLANQIVILSPGPAVVVADIENEPCTDEVDILERAANVLRRPEIREALFPRDATDAGGIEAKDAPDGEAIASLSRYYSARRS